MQLSRPLVVLLNRLQPSAAAVMLVLAILVGLGSGAGVLLFRWSIDVAQEFYWHQLAVVLSSYSRWSIALIPVIGGLVVSVLRSRLQQTEVGFGNLSNAVAREGGRLPYAQIPLKTAAAALSLGAGASLGPEGPSVELGSNIGSLLGQLLGFSTERTRLLVGAGAAAGLAAGFNAPIAGVFFALEVLLGDTFGTTKTSFNSNVSVVVIAAVVSALVAQIGLGGQPAFNLPAYDVRSYWELPLYLGLGLLASLVAVAFTKALQIAREVFAGQIVGFAWMTEISMPSKLAIGGLCIGVTALVFPEVMGIGYETVESLLQDAHFSVGLLVLLLFTKLALTAISLGSGFVGGIFAPAIFLGAILGSAYGQALGSLLPGFIPVAAPPAYALVGMAAVLAGTVRAPLTAVLLLFEMTRDYRIVLPLMASVGLCAWLVEQLQSGQVSGLGAKKDANAEDVEMLSKIKIAEVMSVHPLTFKYSTPILQAAQIFTSGYFHSALVVDDSHHLLGILTTQDIERALSLPKLSQHFSKLTVQEVCTKEVLYTFADESLADAIRRMAARDLQQLPVVDRHSTSRVVGIVDREAIASAYTNALTKQAIANKIASNKAESPHIIEPKEADGISVSSEITPDDLRSEALSAERIL